MQNLVFLGQVVHGGGDGGGVGGGESELTRQQTDNQPDGQTDRQTDRQKSVIALVAPSLYREAGRLIM